MRNIRIVFLAQILLIVLVNSCGQREEKKVVFKGNGSFVGQWYAKGSWSNHWLMLDSMNNLYQWEFDETIPKQPTAKYLIQDSIIQIVRPPEFGLGESIDSMVIREINPKSIKMVPLPNIIRTSHLYKRDTFLSPTFADIYTFSLPPEAVDSIVDSENLKEAGLIKKNEENLEGIFTMIEHTGINWEHSRAKNFTIRDGTTYDKHDLGDYGIVYYTNDTSFVRKGIPNKDQLKEDIESIFPFIGI